MKKITYTFLVVIFVLLTSGYILLFTSVGNNFLKPKIEEIITQKSGMNIRFDSFEIRFSTLDIKANLDNKFFVNIDGKLSPLSLGFDLNYLIGLQKNYIKELKLSNQQDFTFKGNIVGKSNDFNVNGSGFLFNSNLSLKANIVDFTPLNLQLLGKEIDIAQILDFANLPRYVQGKINIITDISAKDLKPNGNSLINFYTSSVDSTLIQKDFNLSLPKENFIKGEIKSSIQNGNIISKSEILSNFFKFYTKQSVYEIQNNKLKSDFEIFLDDFNQFSNIAKIKLQGKGKINGDLEFTQNQLQKLNATIYGFGGELKTTLLNNNLNINTTTIEIAQLLKTISMPEIIDSKLQLNFNAQGLDFKNFDMFAELKNANINTNEFKKINGLDFPKTSFNLQAKANAKNSLINYEALMDSNIAKISNLSGSYNLENKNLNTNINAFIDNLNKLKVLTKQNLNGPLNIDAKIDLKDNIINNLDANIKIMQGLINAKSNGKSLQAIINNVKLEQIFPLIGQQTLAYGDIDAKVELNSLDINNLNGKFNANINSSFNEIELSKLLNKKFPKNTSAKANIEGKINKSILDFDAKILSSFANINTFKGKFDLNKILLQSTYDISLNDFSTLGFLIDRKLKGKADFNGQLNFENNLIDANIISKKIFEGQMDATLKNNILQANIKNVDLSNLAQSLDFPDYYEAKSDVKANYNLLTENGELSLDLKNGKLKKNLMTNTLMLLLQKDITEDVYRSGNANAIINKNLIDLNLDLLADRSKINITKGKINTQNSALNIPFNIEIDRAKFKGTINGTTENPKIKLDTKSTLNTIKNIITGENPKEEKNKNNKGINQLFNKIF
ncbi:hypothetical protein CINS5955_00920 [Campylobacter insulaenigrae]|uniref:hypothetical protein n=1 Tax=Campylobacter insulaenigrae TaxID=260714 RepID=UPI002153323B|nr:hypothetical protein [Campylobacter insulaenigrae]MCR6578013.1 hypothetical protein [Campylobacter insulaenigrae]